MPANGFSIKPLKVELLAGEQKATEIVFVLPYHGLDSLTSKTRQLSWIAASLSESIQSSQTSSESRPSFLLEGLPLTSGTATNSCSLHFFLETLLTL